MCINKHISQKLNCPKRNSIYEIMALWLFKLCALIHLAMICGLIAGESIMRDEDSVKDETSDKSNLGDTLQKNSLSSWEPPLEFQKRFPFYHSGYDHDGIPVWIIVFGHFDLRNMVERGEGPLFEQYIEKFLFDVLPKQWESISTADNKVDEAVLIGDFDGSKMEQLLHLPTIELFLGLIQKYRHVADKHLRRFYVVNANYVAEMALSMGRPFFGRTMEKIQVYGNNRAKWAPVLLQTIPADQIPARYGGTTDHKTVLIFG